MPPKSKAAPIPATPTAGEASPKLSPTAAGEATAESAAIAGEEVGAAENPEEGRVGSPAPTSGPRSDDGASRGDRNSRGDDGAAEVSPALSRSASNLATNEAELGDEDSHWLAEAGPPAAEKKVDRNGGVQGGLSLAEQQELREEVEAKNRDNDLLQSQLKEANSALEQLQEAAMLKEKTTSNFSQQTMLTGECSLPITCSKCRDRDRKELVTQSFSDSMVDYVKGQKNADRIKSAEATAGSHLEAHSLDALVQAIRNRLVAIDGTRCGDCGGYYMPDDKFCNDCGCKRDEDEGEEPDEEQRPDLECDEYGPRARLAAAESGDARACLTI